MSELNPTQAEIDRVNAIWEARKNKPSETVPLSPEQIEAARAYWETVFDEKKHKPNQSLFVSRPVKQEMEYEKARREVGRILLDREEQIEIIQDRPFKWIFNETDKNRLKNITKYFINDPTSEYPLTKGLFLYGANGTMKTETMAAMEIFCKQNDLTKKFYLNSLSSLYAQSRTDKDFDPITAYVQFDRCFDELGRYVGPILRYGDPLDINEVLIEERYGRNRRYGQLTHYIANATTNELNQALSPVVFDRFRSTCTGIYFEGTSKR